MNILKNERGSALLICLLMIALLSLIGVFSAQNSRVENRIAGNDKLHKESFHEAEGGIHAAKELIVKNLEFRNWTPVTQKGSIKVLTGNIYKNVPLLSTDYATDGNLDSYDGHRDAYFPANITTNSQPHVNLRIGVNQGLTDGASILSNAAYEPEGHSGKAGVYTVYDIRSQRQGRDNSMARILARYLHLVKNE